MLLLVSAILVVDTAMWCFLRLTTSFAAKHEGKDGKRKIDEIEDVYRREENATNGLESLWPTRIQSSSDERY
jgi:hypothetical protein